MVKELRTPKNKYKISVDNTKLTDGRHEASIVKFQKRLTLKMGFTDCPQSYGKIDFEVTNNVLYVLSVALNGISQREYNAFLSESSSTINKFFDDLCKENNLSGLRIDDSISAK